MMVETELRSSKSELCAISLLLFWFLLLMCILSIAGLLVDRLHP